ncbi:phosphate metabolism protein 7 [Ciborinia camelliae]|nr:phosphate metabolism protein 7 [Ciborinia camelliae]
MASDTTDTTAGAGSLSALVATLAPTFVVAAVYFVIFLFLRRSNVRWYAPRTYLGALREEERTKPLPSGWFNWIGPFRQIPDIHTLQHQGLDAYLFLRFLRMTVVVMFAGCCITWPILFPINATGGAGSSQLAMLSMSNIDSTTSSGRNRYYATCFVGWIFYGFVLFLITRETIYYVNLRQAYLLNPTFANRISSRTVLFVSVPAEYLEESKLRKVFGSAVRHIWIAADTEKLDELVEKRDEIAYKLEGAEVKLIRTANGERLKAIKNGASQVEPVIEDDGESGSLASRWIPQKQRPTHKLGKFGLYGKKVDTINWARSQLEDLIPETEAAQSTYLAGETRKVGSVFIEFAHQSDAQIAFQTLSHHQALQMSPRYIGVHPSEVIWKSLTISWWQRVVRRFAVVGFIAALIVFWAIPVAFVGLISNITYLESFSWLHWLTAIPSWIMGVISGLLPSVALSILMSLVPVIMRLCARISGEPTAARVELFTQNAYFAFQVIQVFLVVTIASSASSVIYQIINSPTGILSLLANKLPSASNFYISYFIVQGLTVAAGVISQVVGFFVFKILYKFLAGTPRKMYMKWTSLSAISWGSTLPVFTNIAVIGITYSCIAPLVMGFATIGMGLFYLAYRYNVLFVTDTQIDTKGLIYPRALQQLMTGVYLSELCLIGLFAIGKAWGPLILMIIFLVFTVLYHVSLNAAMDPLLHTLPRTLEAEEESIRGELEAGVSGSPTVSHEKQNEKNGPTEIAPVSKPQGGIFAKFFKPHVHCDYAAMRALMPHSSIDPDNLYDEVTARNAYYPPSVVSEAPLLWIPRDDAGISTQEVAHTSKIIPITDEGCTLDEKNKLVWDVEGARPPLWQPKVFY